MLKQLRRILKGSKDGVHAGERVPTDPWDLSTRIASFSDTDHLTIGRAVEGIAVFGAIGSGKTSGSGRMIALSYLLSGFGGLVLCAKPDERELWEQYCREAGRLDDLVIFSPKEKWRFNPVDFEKNRAGDGAGLTENLVNLIEVMKSACNPQRGKTQGGENAQFFDDANKQLTRNAIEALGWGTGHVTIPDLYRFITSAPNTLEDVRNHEWRKNSFCFQVFAEAESKPKTAPQERDFGNLLDYFWEEWPLFPEKTRKSIAATFTTAADVLRRGMLRDLFGGETNIDPTATERGKIILVDLPVLEYGPVGRMAQILWKYPFQQALSRRNTRLSPRPVFLWQDEAHLFLTEDDFRFQSVCRSFRVATVMLSQNISNYYAMLGGVDHAESQIDSLLGCLNLKIFHANGDSVTNTWAAELLSKERTFLINASSGPEDDDDVLGMLLGTSRSRGNAGISESVQYQLEPGEFARLRTGGPANKWCVDAILYSNGSPFQFSGRQWMRTQFMQK